jgi:hypothetical protein
MAIVRASFVKNIVGRVVIYAFGFGLLVSCSDHIPTDDQEKYFQYIPEFHYTYFSPGIDAIKSNELSLYVDYSTCNILGQNSPFYQALIPSWVEATRHHTFLNNETTSK